MRSRKSKRNLVFSKRAKVQRDRLSHLAHEEPIQNDHQMELAGESLSHDEMCSTQHYETEGEMQVHGVASGSLPIDEPLPETNIERECLTEEVALCEVKVVNVATDDEVLEEPLPELVIERECLIKEVPLNESRRLVDLARFVEEIRKIERHSMECNHGGRLVHMKTAQIGMAAELHFRCCKSMCPVTQTVQTTIPESVHLDSVFGTTGIGIGYRQMEELCTTLQSPYISETVYKKYERQCGHVLESCQKESTLAAIEEEKNMAKTAGNIDEDGNVCITAIVDGGWSKRSYGHTYNAKSGAAVIIGDQTKKVLFSGTRNKYCTICTLARNKGVEPTEHECNSNWDGSSTAMEANIIVEGLRWLQKDHKVLCTRIVGDGDSSVMTAIRTELSYGDRVQKVECSNHAIKNFRKKLEAIAENTKAFRGANGLKARRLLQCKTKRLAKTARCVLRRHAISDPKTVTSDAITKLRRAIDNIPFHVFGQHNDCDEKSVCHQKSEKNSVPFLKTVTNFFESVEEVTDRLSSLSTSLIYNVNSNLAEHFMSAKAKTIGGKRVDFSKGQGYTRRVNAATLSYNKPGQAWHVDVHKSRYRRSPKSPLAKLIKKRNRQLECTRKSSAKRKLTFCDLSDDDNSEQLQQRKKKARQMVADDSRLDYGSCDAEPHVLKERCEEYYKKHVCVADAKRKEIEETTRMQGNGTDSERINWMKMRRIRLSASNSYEVCHRRPTTPSAGLVRRLLVPNDVQNEATKHGHDGEKRAKQKYAEKYGVTVEDCGLFVDKDYQFLCASPDGIIHTTDESYLLEVKSPYIARTCSSIDAAMNIFGNRIPVKKDKKGKYFLPKSHRYFCQVQVQLQCANLERCDYIVYIFNDMAVVSIHRDRKFMKEGLPKLKEFYMDCILPELADSRLERNLPLREPQRIRDAISAAAIRKCKKEENARKRLEAREATARSKQQKSVQLKKKH